MPGRPKRIARKWAVGTKRVAGKIYQVIKRGASWLVMQAGKLIAMFLKGVIYTFSRDVGKTLARRVFAAPVIA